MSEVLRLPVGIKTFWTTDEHFSGSTIVLSMIFSLHL